eukprot:459052-Rhodomonas_salina.1
MLLWLPYALPGTPTGTGHMHVAMAAIRLCCYGVDVVLNWHHLSSFSSLLCAPADGGARGQKQRSGATDHSGPRRPDGARRRRRA